MNRLIKFEKDKEQKAKKKKKQILPFYLVENLPDRKMMPAKIMVSKIPDNVERPSFEKLDIMVNQLY